MILFKYLFLSIEKVHYFKEFDSFTDATKRDNDGRKYKVIYLKNDGKRIKKIRSLYYSNSGEIEEHLSNQLGYWGEEDTGFF